MKSRVTTKRGDRGESAALDGQTYSKAHPIMHCVGAVDEARARLALLQRLLASDDKARRAGIVDLLHWVAHTLFVIGTECSDPCVRHPEYRRSMLDEQDLQQLEEAQMGLEAELELPSAFIVGASTIPAAHADLACTAVRRLERAIASLHECFPDIKAGIISSYVNRLSDYLYILARWLEDGHHIVVDYSMLEKTPKQP